jgi:hypothetical protein
MQMADMRLSRNMAIVGIAIMLGTVIPMYITEHPLFDANGFGLHMVGFIRSNTSVQTFTPTMDFGQTCAYHCCKH